MNEVAILVNETEYKAKIVLTQQCQALMTSIVSSTNI